MDKAIQAMEMSSDTSPSADQGIAGTAQKRPRDALDDRIDELEQRLAALTADRSPSRSSNASFRTAREEMTPKLLSQNARGKHGVQDSPKRPKPVFFPPQGSRSQNFITTHPISRPTTSHRASTRPSTRRSSTAPTSQVPSASSSRREGRAPTSTRPSVSSSRRGATGVDSQGASASSSRHSSFKVNQPAGAQTSRSVRLNRRYNTTWPPPTVIRDGRQALQSIQAFSDLRDDVFSGMQAEERLKSSSLPTLPRPTTADTTVASLVSTANDLAGETLQNPHEYSNHVPAANIDWTLPSTRRREYEKIDKARSGFRGLIRRVTPRILRKNGRDGFHDDEKGSDAGTVRRFRMDVADGDSTINETATSPWWRFDKKEVKGKGKGNLSTEEGTELKGVKKAERGREKAIEGDHELGENGQQAAVRKDTPDALENDEGTGSPLMAASGRVALGGDGALEKIDRQKVATEHQLLDTDGTNEGENGRKTATGRRKSSVEGRKKARTGWKPFSLAGRRRSRMHDNDGR